MTFIKGDIQILYIQRDGEYYPIACLDNNSFSESSDEIETTTRDNGGWTTTQPTNQSYEIAFSGFVENSDLPDTKFSFWDLVDYKRNRTLLNWRIGEATENYDYGQGYIIDVSEDAPIDEFITFSGTIRGYGKPKNLLKEIYDGWESSVLGETSGSVSSKRCVLKEIQELIL